MLYNTAQHDSAFLYLGETPDTSRTCYAVKVPYPNRDNAAFETRRMVDAGRNLNGELVGRMVGRSLQKQSLAWARMPCHTWWEMHRWFEAGHFTFYCHFFNHSVGAWQTRLFYMGDVAATPARVNTATGTPAYYTNASFSVIDCGVM